MQGVKELPEVEYINIEGGAVIIAAAVYAPPCARSKAWEFVFRGTIPILAKKFFFDEVSAWYDWQVVPAANNQAAAVLKLQKMAAERMITKIEIVRVSDPAMRAELAAARGQR